MSDTQKTFVIVGLTCILMVFGLHILFIPRLERTITSEHVELEMDDLASEPVSDDAESTLVLDENYILALERRIHIVSILKFVFLGLGLVFLVSSYFVRRKKTEDFTNVWGDDEWDDDEWEEENDNENEKK